MMKKGSISFLVLNLLVASTVFSYPFCVDESGSNEIQTFTVEYYDLLQPRGNYSLHDLARLKLNNTLYVVGFQISISTFELLHVQVWLWIDDRPNHTFSYVNSGSSGSANIAIMFGEERLVIRPPYSLMIGVWADNMYDCPRDYHIKATIYFFER